MKLRINVFLQIILVAIAFGQNTQDIEARLAQTKVEMATGNWAVAQSMLQSMIADDDSFAPAHFELSVVSLKRDDLKGAQTHISKAIELDPRNEEYRSEAERVAGLSGGMSRASRNRKDLDFDNAIIAYEKVIAEYPNFASAHFGLGLAMTKSGSARAAANAFREAIRLNPESSSYANALRRLVAEKYNEGNRLYNARDWEAAQANYESAIELDPSFHPAYYRLARCFLKLDDPDEAMTTLNRVLKVKPDYANAHVEKGNIFRTNNQFDQAEESYRRAISYDSKSGQAWVGLGVVLKRDRMAEAEEAFKTAMAVNPKSSTALEYLGELLSEQKRWDAALPPLKKASQLKPRDHRTSWRLSVVYNALGRHGEARLQAKRSTDIRKNFEYAWFEKGIAEKALGNRQAALEAFRNAEKGRDASIRKSARYELTQLGSTPN